MSTADRSQAESLITIEAWPLPRALSAGERPAARREALLALDPLVRRQLGLLRTGLAAQTVELTVYDTIYTASPQVGGHWTAAASWFGLLSHAIGSYSVMLVFDESDRPHHFTVTGAATVISDGISEAALAAALAMASAAGPLRTQSAHVFHSAGL
mgnify:CR=1 FL=1